MKRNQSKYSLPLESSPRPPACQWKPSRWATFDVPNPRPHPFPCPRDYVGNSPSLPCFFSLTDQRCTLHFFRPHLAVDLALHFSPCWLGSRWQTLESGSPLTFCGMVRSTAQPRQKQLAKDPLVYFLQQNNQGRARTQSPTTRNYAVEIPTFGEFARVSTTGVQWLSLALGEPPSWSWYLPCQVSMSWMSQRQERHSETRRSGWRFLRRIIPQFSAFSISSPWQAVSASERAKSPATIQRPKT